MSLSDVLYSRPIWPQIRTKCPQCSVPLEFAIPSPKPGQGLPLRVHCFSCNSIFLHIYLSNAEPTKPTASSNTIPVENQAPSLSHTAPITKDNTYKVADNGGIDTQLYYKILDVNNTATAEELTRAYRRLSIRFHPVNNRDNPDTRQKFKQISMAYQTLSEPARRKEYDESGPQKSQPEGEFMNPEAFFNRQLFGGDKFLPLIGHISFGIDMRNDNDKSAHDDSLGPQRITKKQMTPEEKRKQKENEKKEVAERACIGEERVKKLVEELERKLQDHTTSCNDRADTQEWRTKCQQDAEQLKEESYGVDLLHRIGFVYTYKARQFLATKQSFLGVRVWLYNVQGKIHVFSENISLIRAAVDMKQTFDQMTAAEKAGSLTSEEKRKLEELAAEKGFQALSKGTKLEIESVLCKVCDRVLSSPPPQLVARGNQVASHEKLYAKAAALQIMGETFLAVRKEPSSSRNMSI